MGRSPFVRSGYTKVSKLDHVRKATQTRKHACHWPGCKLQVPPAMWGCKEHWYRLPQDLRDRVWVAYDPGQEDRMDPSDAYLAVALEIQQWIETQEQPRLFGEDQ